VTPTLNAFDIGDTRAIVLIIETPVLMRGREGKPGGGKGPLLSEDISLTIATNNDQVLFTPGVLIIDGTRVDDVRVYEDDISQTVISRWGTGGGNVPAIAYSIREDATANNFSATEIETARALQSLQPSVQSHHAQTFVADDAPPSVVRRLTPTECERLQGFPDGWTEDQADSHRYKQMGNAVTVNVISWIGARL
jgi:DNA (cytosine-5)-methyltransferase 1